MFDSVKNTSLLQYEIYSGENIKVHASVSSCLTLNHYSRNGDVSLLINELD